MRIDNNTHLDKLQAWFSHSFPGTRLEFIFSGTEKLKLDNRLSKSFPHVAIKEICPDCPPEGISIDETMTIKDIELLLENRLHLPAGIYVNIGGYWQKNKSTGQLKLQDIAPRNKKISTKDFSV